MSRRVDRCARRALPRRPLHAALVIVLCCASPVALAATSTRAAPATPPRAARGDLLAVLPAAGPHASLGNEARLFDRFVGTWECGCTHFAADGSVAERYAGEVTFGWILDRRAMQDVWIGYPPAGEPRERELGTSIRFYDAKTDRWRVVWVAPEAGVVATVEGGAVGDRIVLEGVNADGSRRRWSFNDIRSDSFLWRAESSRDGGKTWQLTAEYRMTRAARNAPHG